MRTSARWLGLRITCTGSILRRYGEGHALLEAVGAHEHGVDGRRRCCACSTAEPIACRARSRSSAAAFDAARADSNHGAGGGEPGRATIPARAATLLREAIADAASRARRSAIPRVARWRSTGNQMACVARKRGRRARDGERDIDDLAAQTAREYSGASQGRGSKPSALSIGCADLARAPATSSRRERHRNRCLGSCGGTARLRWMLLRLGGARAQSATRQRDGHAHALAKRARRSRLRSRTADGASPASRAGRLASHHLAASSSGLPRRGGAIISVSPWGYSSAGRALAWHARGQRFDPAYLHHTIRGDDGPRVKSNVVVRVPIV